MRSQVAHQLTLCMVLALSMPRALSAQETVRRAISADTVIDGVPCARTGRAPAEFFVSGRLLECPLSRDVVISGHAFPRTSWVIFHADGTLNGAWLARDTVLSGHLCRGEGYKKWSVRFHPDGALRLCFLPATTVIEGVPCRDGTFWGEIRGGGNTAVHFHPSGRLARCQAARAFSVGGVHYEKWAVVSRR
ncbi:MAG: hypothetical protein ABMA00_08685 [Gemmatimonas sp.]